MPLTSAFVQQLHLPDSPGIYLFYSALGELIYVGKATSLKQRVGSYFRGARTPRPIEEMIHEVERIDTHTTDSVLEAVILESIWIKKNQPKYNVLGKDDKSWNYLVLTKEVFPRLRSVRQHDLSLLTGSEAKQKYSAIFGPYPGLNTKAALKLLRRLFFISDCEPARTRPCLYREMGQCLGVCTGEISSAQYRARVIAPLTLFLQGEKKRVISSLEKQMQQFAKVEQFELASRLRDQIMALQRIHDIALINDSFMRDVFPLPHRLGAGPMRIEGYDISNLGNTDKVGSMVVFDESGPVKSQYRKFTIKTVQGQSDVDCLAEVLERRLNHSEWPLPNIFLIDGGRPQVHRAVATLASRNVTVPVIGLAKGPERKRNDVILGDKRPETALFASRFLPLLIRVRDEAHRFAITFNRSKRLLRNKEHRTRGNLRK